MAFDEIRFPTDISYGAVGGPGFSTTVIQQASGYESRNANWLAARHGWDVSHGLKTKAQLAELQAFFFARGGRARGFRFFDWLDHEATGQPIGTGDNATTVFQLRKTYQSGGVTHSRDIVKVVEGEEIESLGVLATTVYLDGAPQGSGWSLDPDTGLVTFATAPGPGVAVGADFHFDVPARFDTDRMEMSIEDFELHDWGRIPIVEVRP